MVEERWELPRHLRASTRVVRVVYGGFSDGTAHTESVTLGQLTFSLIPEMSYLWLLETPRSSLRALREARRLWPVLRPLFSSTLYAHAAGKREADFLRFFNFTEIAEHEGVTYFQELSHGL